MCAPNRLRACASGKPCWSTAAPDRLPRRVNRPAAVADNTDAEIERMADQLMVEAMGEGDWLANATGTCRRATREMAIQALTRAAIKLRARGI
jgi:hypothetical protein